ncbi:hypothetical protein Tsubulata_040307, partial [Turnera subulata]
YAYINPIFPYTRSSTHNLIKDFNYKHYKACQKPSSLTFCITMGLACFNQTMLLVFVLLAMVATMAQAQGTRVGFYSTTCPRVETIVRNTVQSHFRSDPAIAPGLLRMHFHDCFVHGCDASILIDGANTEKTAGPNLLLRGYDVIADAKTQLESACPGVVSCADILSLAARDSVVVTGGLTWPVPTGRRDGTVSLASDTANLPAFTDSVDVQKQKFSSLGLNTQDLVALSGAHTIGTSACQFFRYRLYNFTTTGNGVDASIDPTFVSQLQTLCPQNGDGSRRVALDTGSQNRFDSSYFANLRSGRGILESDQKLWTDPTTRTFVQRFLGVRGLAGLTFNVHGEDEQYRCQDRNQWRNPASMFCHKLIDQLKEIITQNKSRHGKLQQRSIDLFIISPPATFGQGQSQGTRVGFYSQSCPRAESIVRSTVESHFRRNQAIAPGLLRMHFHDCFVQGCDASVLINGPNTERTAGPNLGLNGFQVIDDAKTQLENACPGIVSCADILTLAARDSVVLTRGLRWEVPTGRRDGRVSLASEASTLPGFTESIESQIKKFEQKGLNAQDLVTLVGAHTIGTTACQFFKYRLYNFTTTGNGADPSINPAFVRQLQALCPQNGDGATRVALDAGSANRFDANFFANLRNGRGVLESDQKLWTDASTRTFVQRFLGVRGLGALNFNVEFGRSMVKMGNIGVKTGTEGEIRRNKLKV